MDTTCALGKGPRCFAIAFAYQIGIWSLESAWHLFAIHFHGHAPSLVMTFVFYYLLYLKPNLDQLDVHEHCQEWLSTQYTLSLFATVQFETPHISLRCSGQALFADDA